MTEQEVMVSIICNTYNHEKFIADAIEGFLMQETKFDFEILIHDDASTDRTAEIVRSYEEKHPFLIKPIYQSINQYSRGIKPYYAFNYPRAKGKYIALCEGDDYWTDTKKLQIQFECLENNPRAICCFHDEYMLVDNVLIKESRMHPQNPRSCTGYEMMTWKCRVFPLTLFFRNLDILKNFPKEANYIVGGDAFLISMLGQYGSAIYLPTIKASVYRVHEGGVWSMKSERERRAIRINNWYWISEYHSRMGNHKVEAKFKNLCIDEVSFGLSKMQLISVILKICLPSVLIKFVLKYFKRK